MFFKTANCIFRINWPLKSTPFSILVNVGTPPLADDDYCTDFTKTKEDKSISRFCDMIGKFFMQRIGLNKFWESQIARARHKLSRRDKDLKLFSQFKNRDFKNIFFSVNRN